MAFTLIQYLRLTFESVSAEFGPVWVKLKFSFFHTADRLSNSLFGSSVFVGVYRRFLISFVWIVVSIRSLFIIKPEAARFKRGMSEFRRKEDLYFRLFLIFWWIFGNVWSQRSHLIFTRRVIYITRAPSLTEVKLTEGQCPGQIQFRCVQPWSNEAMKQYELDYDTTPIRQVTIIFNIILSWFILF